MTSTDPSQDLTGRVLSGRYALEARIGQGAMGTVYRAEHTLMRKRVAVKVLHPELCRNEEVVRRFQREAQAAAHLDHPNICAATDFGRIDLTDEDEDVEQFFLVMEHLEGETLGERLERVGELGVEEAVEIALQVASALARAHALDVVHRDLKPDNIFLARRDGQREQVKILDFGIARVHLEALEGGQAGDDGAPTATLSRAGAIYGTPRYLSPEQASGEEADARSDLYSLGIVLYEMLHGDPPFHGKGALQIIGMHMTRAPDPLPPHVPAALAALVARLLEKSPDDRYESASALLGELRQAAHPDPALGDVAPVVASGPQARKAISATLSGDLPVDTSVRSGDAPAVLRGHSGEQPSATRRVWLAILLVIAASLIAVGLIVGLSDDDDEPSDEDATPSLDEAPGFAATDDDPASLDRVLEQATDAARPLEEQEAIAAALHLLDEGYVDAGLERLAELEAEWGEHPRFHELMLGVQQSHGRKLEALQTLEKIASKDPARVGDESSLPLLIEALETRSGEVPDTAERLLRTWSTPTLSASLGRRVVAEGRSRLGRRLYAILEEGNHLDELEPWLRTSVELRATSRGKCSVRRELLERLIALGNPEAMIAVDAVSEEPDDGCGLLELSDCNECLRSTLREAREALSSATP